MGGVGWVEVGWEYANKVFAIEHAFAEVSHHW